MFTAYIFRHGKTELNKQKRLQGHLDSPLIAEGIENAHSIAAKVKGITFDAGVYSSDLGRAFITAYAVAQDLGDTRPITTDKALREVSFGDLAGQPIAEAESRNPGLQRETGLTPPAGESLGDMQRRVVQYILDLAQEHDGQTALIGTHDCVINALYAEQADVDLGPYNGDHYNPHDFVAKLTVEDGKITSFKEHSAPSTQ